MFLLTNVHFIINTFKFLNAAVFSESDQYSSLSISNSIFQTNQGPLIFIESSPNYVVVICNCSFKDNIAIESLYSFGVLIVFGYSVQNLVGTELN